MDIKARLPGQIVELNVNIGDVVKAKDVLGKIEALKMERPIPTPEEGTVKEIKVAIGDKIKSGQVIFVIE